MDGLKKLKTKDFWLVVWAVACSLVTLAIATDIGNRYKPVKSFKDDRSVSDVNDNFRRVTLNLIDDRAFNVPVGNGTTSVVIQLASVQTDISYAIFVQTSWNSSIRVTSKTTTSFAVTYTDPASATQTLDWILVR